MIKSFFKEQKGGIAVILALAMSVLAGFTALALDLGSVYFEKQRLINIVDAAALAGAQEIAGDYLAAENKAREYAQLNGAEIAELSITTDHDQNLITVQAKRKVPFSFAKVLGFSGTEVNAQAVAGIGNAGKVKGIVPFGIPEQSLTFGQLYNLKVSSPPTLGSGNFGALSLGGNGANRYRNNIKYGYQEWVKVGDIIETETGNMSGPTMTGVNYRVANESHSYCAPDNFRRDCPRLVTVPIYEPLGHKNQIKKVRVKGFAAFLLKAVTGHGNESNIKGYFIQTIVPGEISEDAGDYGLNVVKLSQ